MSSNRKQSNPEAAQRRRLLLDVWKAHGAIESLTDQWMDDSTWAKSINENCSRMLPNGLVVTSQMLNEVVSKEATLKDAVDLTENSVGLYRHTYYGGKDGSGKGKKRVRTYQWRTPGMKKYDPQPKSKHWSERLHNPFWSERAAREPAKKKARTEPAAEDNDNVGDDCDDSRSSSPSGAAGESRRAVDPDAEVIPPGIYTSDSDSDSDYSDDDSDADGKEVDLFGVKELPEGANIYYVSTEAKKLFAAQMEETAYDAIEQQIAICSAVYNNRAP